MPAGQQVSPNHSSPPHLSHCLLEHEFDVDDGEGVDGSLEVGAKVLGLEEGFELMFVEGTGFFVVDGGLAVVGGGLFVEGGGVAVETG